MSCNSKGQINRRQLLAGAAVLAISSACADGLAEETLKEISDLRPGQFTWKPDRQPTGPVAIVVSLPEQGSRLSQWRSDRGFHLFNRPSRP